MARLGMTYSDSTSVLILSGDICELQADELRSHLQRGIYRTQLLVVDCGQATSLDITCLKLLCTAFRVARLLNKSFVLAGNRDGLFRRATGPEAGRCAESGIGCGHTCLWSDAGRDRADGSLGTESNAAAA